MLRFPVDYVAITQKFSATHGGLDLGWKSDPNMPIYAPMDGTIAFEGYFSNGEICSVVHNKELNIMTIQGHLSKSITNDGDSVKQHQQIGNMGSTGNSTAPHCHYEVWANVPDDLKFTENTIQTNRAKYKVDPLTITYLFPDQTANEESYKIVKKSADAVITKPVERNENVPQIKVIADILSVRTEHNTISTKLGIAQKNGIYNDLEVYKDNQYTWHRIADNQWVADDGTWLELLPVIDYEKMYNEQLEINKKLQEENNSLKLKLKDINKISTI